MTKSIRNVIAAAVALLAFLPSGADAVVFGPTSFTLANGLQVIVVPNHLAPVVSQMVWYKVGSADEKRGKTGLAHYLEHLMFRGTTDVGPDQFSRIIAAYGGNENAFTVYDYTAFFETVAVDNLAMIMKLEADRMQNLHITAETATPELSVVLNERHQRTDNNPEGKFTEKLRHDLMPHHPYGTPVIGWKHEIEHLSAKDAATFYKEHYAPNNAVVIISGDVAVEDVMRLAASIYGPVPRHKIAARPPLAEATSPLTQDLTMVDVGVQQPQYIWEAVVPSYSTQKGSEAYAYEVLAEVLDGGEVGILYHKLVSDMKIASNTGTEYDPDARGDTTFSIGVTPYSNRAKTVKQLGKTLQEILKEVCDHGIDEKAVDNAKRRLERSAIFARDSLMTPGYSFGAAIATGHNVTDVEAWPDRIGAVTTEQVNEALRSLVSNPHSISGYLLPDPHATAAAREAAQPIISRDMGIR